MTAPPPARKRKNGNLTVPVLLSPGRRRPPYSLLRRTPATSAPIRSPAAQTGFSPACTRGTSPHPPHLRPACLKKPLRLECPGGSFGQAHRPEAPTAAVQKHAKHAGRTNPHKPCDPKPAHTVQAAKAACVRPPRTRLRADGAATAPAATARATPARDRPRGCGRSIRR